MIRIKHLLFSCIPVHRVPIISLNVIDEVNGLNQREKAITDEGSPLSLNTNEEEQKLTHFKTVHCGYYFLCSTRCPNFSYSLGLGLGLLITGTFCRLQKSWCQFLSRGNFFLTHQKVQVWVLECIPKFIPL